jgi:hypothetical protein
LVVTIATLLIGGLPGNKNAAKTNISNEIPSIGVSLDEAATALGVSDPAPRSAAAAHGIARQRSRYFYGR